MNNEAKLTECCENVGLNQKLFDACAETAAGIGHELNNPLAIIAGHAQNLLKNETSEEKRWRLSAILEQTNRAFEMIVDLRAFARPPQPIATTVDVEKFCDDWARREAKRCEENDVRLETAFEFGGNAPTLMVDEAMLAAILNALTKNAVEATGCGGVVRIFARECNIAAFSLKDLENKNFGANIERRAESGGAEFNAEADVAQETRCWELGVEDDGPGLSSEARELLFAPYFSGRQAGRGLGVGLAKARRFAETLGVELRCRQATSFDSGVCWSLFLRY